MTVRVTSLKSIAEGKKHINEVLIYGCFLDRAVNYKTLFGCSITFGIKSEKISTFFCTGSRLTAPVHLMGNETGNVLCMNAPFTPEMC